MVGGKADKRGFKNVKIPANIREIGAVPTSLRTGPSIGQTLRVILTVRNSLNF